MSQYLSQVHDYIKEIFNTLKSKKITKPLVKQFINPELYDKLNKDLENYVTRSDMAGAISYQTELSNKLILLEGLVYQKLHGNITMQLREECDAIDVNCIEHDNLNVIANKYSGEIEYSFYLLNQLMGRQPSEYIKPDDNAKVLFLIELLCSDQPIEYRTSVSENLRDLLETYCSFSSNDAPIDLPESVQHFKENQRFGVSAGPSIRMQPGFVPQQFTLNNPKQTVKNIWKAPSNTGGKKSRRKTTKTKAKKSKGKKTIKHKIVKKRGNKM